MKSCTNPRTWRGMNNPLSEPSQSGHAEPRDILLCIMLSKLSRLAISCTQLTCARVECFPISPGLAPLLRIKKTTAHEEISSFAFLLFRANRPQRD